MKILHTGDWHIGKLVHGLYMTEDQAFILEEFLALVEREKIDVVVIAGDLYDRSVPPTHAVDLLNRILSHLILELKVKVIAISGNHDSPDRLDFGSQILRDQGLYMIGNLTRPTEVIVLKDEHGPVNFYPIPYAEPALVRSLWEAPQVRCHDDAMRAIINDLPLDPGVRNVCISHAFVMGTDTLETSDSERPLAIGGSEFVSVDHFEAFDYVALGHLHRPQKVKHDHIRYSGSLLKYSFSEAKQLKSVTIIDLGRKNEADIYHEVLTPRRDMRIIRGDLDQLLEPEVYRLANREDYIHAVITDPGQAFEPMKRLRAVYPNILQLERAQETHGLGQTEIKRDLKALDPIELFENFYTYAKDSPVTDDQISVYKKTYQALMDQERKS